MPQFFGSEKITKLFRVSNTQVSLPSGFSLKVGGQGFSSDTALTLTTSVSGIGGLDTGSIANLTFYYVYVVYNGSVLGLVASTSATAPTGFLAYRKVGAFYTNSSGQVFKAYFFGEIVQQTRIATTNAAGTILTGSSIFTGNPAQSVSGANRVYTYTLTSNIYTVAPKVSINLNEFSSSTAQNSISVPSTTETQIVISSSRQDGATEVETQLSHTLIIHNDGVDATQPDWSL